jgi:membrane fusion protein, multidrug efflux system
MNTMMSAAHRPHGEGRSLFMLTVMASTCAALSLVLLAGCDGSAAQAAPTQAAAPVAVQVQTLRVQPMTVWSEFSGRLEAVDRAELRPRVAGTVVAVYFKEGALVGKGDLLLALDPAPYQAEVDHAQAQVASAQARVAQARVQWNRTQRLAADKAVAQRDLDDRTSELNVAQADLQAAQAALKTAQLNLSYTQVRAPFSGRIGRHEVTVGNQVAAGPASPVLTTLVSVDPIYVSFSADEAALKDLSSSRGDLAQVPVRIRAVSTGAEGLRGHLQLIDNQVDPQSGTVRLRGVFANPKGALTPGQFASVALGTAHAQNVMLLDERAVGTDQSKRFVWVVGADNKVSYREVSLGVAVGNQRMVAAGLKAGERVVVEGVQRVQAGAMVAASELKAEPATTARTESGSATTL